MEPMACLICRRTFPSFDEYIQHTCCKPLVDNWVPTVICDNCNNGFPSVKTLLNHVCLPMIPPRKKMRLDDETPKVNDEMTKTDINQVGRGRRTSLGSRAQIETFKPQNTQDLLREIKEQEMPIRDHLIDRLHNLLKWYIVVFAEFKRDVPTGDGTITEETRQDYISSPTFTAYNTMDIDQDLPTAFK